jgi:hypothetical protein
MPTRIRSVQFPSIAHRTHATREKTIEVAPGIFASNHEAEQRFFLTQASHMKMLANSAGVKERDTRELKRLKKCLKAAQSCLTGIASQSKQKSAIVCEPDHQLREQISAKDMMIENHTQAANALEQAHENDKRDALAELHQRTVSLETNLKNVVEERENAQSTYNAFGEAFTDIHAESTTRYDQDEALKSKESVWQADLEQSGLFVKKHEIIIEELQSQMKDLNDKLKAEQAAHNTIQQHLTNAFALVASTKLDLDRSKKETQNLKTLYAALQERHEVCAFRRDYCDKLEGDLEDLRRENEDLVDERDKAAKAQADEVYAAFTKDREMAALKSELDTKSRMLETLLHRQAGSHVTAKYSLEDNTIVDTIIDGGTKHIEPITATADGFERKSSQTSTTLSSSPPATMTNRHCDPDDVVLLNNAMESANKSFTSLDFREMIINPSNPFSTFLLMPIVEESEHSDVDWNQVESGIVDQSEEGVQSAEEFVATGSNLESITSIARDCPFAQGDETANPEQTVSNYDSADDGKMTSDIEPSTEPFQANEDAFKDLTEHHSSEHVEEVDYCNVQQSAMPNEQTDPEAESKVPMTEREYEPSVDDAAPSPVSSSTNTGSLTGSISSMEQQPSGKSFVSFAEFINATKYMNENNKKTTTAKESNVAFDPMASDFTPSFAAPPDREILADPRDMAATPISRKEWSIKGAAEAKNSQENRAAALAASSDTVSVHNDLHEQLQPASSILSSGWAPQNTSSASNASRPKYQSRSPQTSSGGMASSRWSPSNTDSISRNTGLIERPANGRRGERGNGRARGANEVRGDDEHGDRSRRYRGRRNWE